MPVIDSHVHIQPWNLMRPEVLDRMRRGRDFDLMQQVMADPARFIAILDDAGVERAWLMNYVAPDTMGFTFEANEFGARYAASHPNRMVAFGSVHPRFSKDPEGDMNRLRDLGVRGLKVHGPHQLFRVNDYLNGNRTIQVMYEKAQEWGWPVLIHTGTSIFHGARNKYGDPMDVEDVVLDFPRLRVIMAHGGRPLWMPTAIFLVRRFENLYFDVSSIPPQSLLTYFPKLEGLADKCLFGTDWPAPMVPGVKANLEKFLELPLPEEARRKILYENARKLLP
ncbi:MAG: amidohydrolase family protein [Planctomycetota bacterium]